jgi:L,D-transpeptidase catalytic domain
VLAIVAAGCGGAAGEPPAAASPSSAPPAELHDGQIRLAAPTAPKSAPPHACTSPAEPLRSARSAYGAVVHGRALAFDRPAGRLIRTFEVVNQNGVPTVLGVLARRRCAETWYRVQLPVRPNGATGWVRSADVRLVRVHARIVVDLDRRKLTLLRNGHVVLRTVIAYGAPGTPTPIGDYYVNQKLVAPDPAGPFGPAAIGISAFSPTLTHWAQGGPVAIHGTNRPDLLGAAVSNGCIRVRNDLLLRLWELAPEGTPVTILA